VWLQSWGQGWEIKKKKKKAGKGKKHRKEDRGMIEKWAFTVDIGEAHRNIIRVKRERFME